MKALVVAFNQEKALVGAFSVIVQLHQLTRIQQYRPSVYHSYLIVQHEGAAAVALARVAAAVSVARAEEDLGDGLEVGLVAVLVGPHQDGHAAQDVNLKYFRVR